MLKAILALADGTVFEGLAFGAQGEAVGEVVFNTGMTGYQEVLTDQSYKGQIVTMTHPHIGNTGVNLEDVESQAPAVEGFVVREACAAPSNWRAIATLEEYLQKHGVVGIQGIDTRALTRHLRDRGAQQGILSTLEEDPERLVAKAQAAPGLVGRDLVQEVTCPEPYPWAQGAWAWGLGYGEGGAPDPGDRLERPVLQIHQRHVGARLADLPVERQRRRRRREPGPGAALRHRGSRRHSRAGSSTTPERWRCAGRERRSHRCRQRCW